MPTQCVPGTGASGCCGAGNHPDIHIPPAAGLAEPPSPQAKPAWDSLPSVDVCVLPLRPGLPVCEAHLRSAACWSPGLPAMGLLVDSSVSHRRASDFLITCFGMLLISCSISSLSSGKCLSAAAGICLSSSFVSAAARNSFNFLATTPVNKFP